MIEAFSFAMRNYANFAGRDRRKQYWMFYLAQTLISLPLAIWFYVAIIDLYLNMSFEEDSATGGLYVAETDPARVAAATMPLILLGIVSLVFLVPSLSSRVRRLHDMGQTGWLILLDFVGLSIVPLVMSFFDSQVGPNQYGPDPKAAERSLNPAGPFQGDYSTPSPGAYAVPPQSMPPAPPAPSGQYPRPPA